jgi:cytochrome P450
MDFEVKRWMARLATGEGDFNFSLEDMAAKVMTTLTWDDPDLSVSCTKSAIGLLTQMSPAGPISNVITPLWNYIPAPINPWKIAEHKRHDEQQAYWMNNLNSVRRKMAVGLARDSFTRRFLETEQKQGLSGDHEASSVIGMMALVGIFTIGGPLNYFLVAMVFHPEWQRKLQDEVDRVCGDRLPNLSDAPQLPILRACIKETMRWKPNVPTGVAHEVEADDIYRGYFIEKGTRILPLDIAMLKNPQKYPDPLNFRPERWLESGWPTYQEPLTQYPNIKGMTSFGWGQRACLGQTLTQDEMMLACGALAWCFNLKHKVDANGNQIPIDVMKSNSLLIVKPDPFQMEFEPRSAAKKASIFEQWESAQKQDISERKAFEEEAMAAKREAASA